MEDANRLYAILLILSSHWDSLSEGFSQNQLAALKNEFNELEMKVDDSRTPEEIEAIASEFLISISKFDLLNEIMDNNNDKMRSGSLPLPEEEIKIKIINYCAIMENKIIIKKDEDQ